MLYGLIKKCIEQDNGFMSKDVIKLQIEFFAMNNKITEMQKNELLGMLEPEVE